MLVPQIVEPSDSDGDELLKSKFIPRSVRLAPAVCGVFLGVSHEITGTSKLKSPFAEPIESETVTAATVVMDLVLPKLGMHVTDVYDTHEVVWHAELPRRALVVRSETPKL